MALAAGAAQAPGAGRAALAGALVGAVGVYQPFLLAGRRWAEAAGLALAVAVVALSWYRLRRPDVP